MPPYLQDPNSPQAQQLAKLLQARGMMQDAVTPVDTSGMVPGSSMSSTEGLAKIAEALVGRHKESQALQGTNGTSSQFDQLGSVYRGVKGILGF